jgi:hypothetical protein
VFATDELAHTGKSDGPRGWNFLEEENVVLDIGDLDKPDEDTLLQTKNSLKKLSHRQS